MGWRKQQRRGLEYNMLCPVVASKWVTTLHQTVLIPGHSSPGKPPTHAAMMPRLLVVFARIRQCSFQQSPSQSQETSHLGTIAGGGGGWGHLELLQHRVQAVHGCQQIWCPILDLHNPLRLQHTTQSCRVCIHFHLHTCTHTHSP